MVSSYFSAPPKRLSLEWQFPRLLLRTLNLADVVLAEITIIFLSVHQRLICVGVVCLQALKLVIPLLFHQVISGPNRLVLRKLYFLTCSS